MKPPSRASRRPVALEGVAIEGFMNWGVCLWNLSACTIRAGKRNWESSAGLGTGRRRIGVRGTSERSLWPNRARPGSVLS